MRFIHTNSRTQRTIKTLIRDIILKLNNNTISGFTKDPSMVNLFTKDISGMFQNGLIQDYTIEIISAGNLAANNQNSSIPSTFDISKIEDIYISKEYKIE